MIPEFSSRLLLRGLPQKWQPLFSLHIYGFRKEYLHDHSIFCRSSFPCGLSGVFGSRGCVPEQMPYISAAVLSVPGLRLKTLLMNSSGRPSNIAMAGV